MSRNFTADQTLTDRLLLNDTKAFEEIYHRYWYSLYFFGLRKLQDKEESRNLVEAVFADLWRIRHTLPATFHLAQYLLEEGKKDVASRLTQKSILSNLGSTEDLLENVESLQHIHGDSPDVATAPRKVVRLVSTTATSEGSAQTWSSEPRINTYMTAKEKDLLCQDILRQIQSSTAYLLLFPKKEVHWWQRIAAMF
jgi:hypothetical protein